jgi:hypothetical protein
MQNLRIDHIAIAAIMGVCLVVSTVVLTGTIGSVAAKNATLKEQQLKNEAVDACAKVAVATYTNKDEAQIIEPFKPTYIACMKDKGYESKMSQ